TMLRDAASARLGLQTDVFVRTVREWRTIIAGNPFPDAAEHDPSHLVVMCLRAAPGRAALSALQGAITGRELVRVRGREAYVVYPDGIGRSRLTNRVLERTLGTSGTGRNWNTVVKLGAMLRLS
ncbi:MAG: DUF1697 domain-containing protein, partial [Acidobacteriota bacterium]|nr:DUF1697 domain-containing protein [Acidobacteriota bacterium]